MPTKRIDPTRRLTNAEYQRRWREKHYQPKEPNWSRIIAWKEKGKPIPYEVSKALGIPATGSGKPQVPPDAKEDILPDHFDEEELLEALATILKGVPVNVAKQIEKKLKKLLEKLLIKFHRDVKAAIAEQLAEERAQLAKTTGRPALD